MKIGIQEQNTWNCTVTTKMKIGIKEQNTWNYTVTKVPNPLGVQYSLKINFHVCSCDEDAFLQGGGGGGGFLLVVGRRGIYPLFVDCGGGG